MGNRKARVDDGRTRDRALRACLSQARLLDMGAAEKLMAGSPHAGLRRLADILGCNIRTAQIVQRGQHWQQDPEKIRVFNELRGAHIPPNGVPSDEDLRRFGISPEQKRANRAVRGQPGNQRRDAYDPDTEVITAATRARALKKDKAPFRLDSAYFQAQVDETLWRIVKQLDDVKIGQMSGKELMAAFAALLEKRAMLRGEPMQIVRNDNRGSLDEVGKMLLAELARRGRPVPGLAQVLDVTPKVVTP